MLYSSGAYSIVVVDDVLGRRMVVETGTDGGLSTLETSHINVLCLMWMGDGFHCRVRTRSSSSQPR